jgi:hypothetical protein
MGVTLMLELTFAPSSLFAIAIIVLLPEVGGQIRQEFHPSRT